MRKILIITLLVIFLVTNIKIAKNSYASFTHPNLNETIYPSLNIITLDRGSQIIKYVTFYNNTRAPIAIKVYAQNFGTVGLNGNISFFVDKSRLASASWFSFPNLNYAVPPKGTIDVPIEIKVPKDATPGGHYVTVFFQSLNTEKLNSNVGVISRLGSLFFITIGGNINYNSRINNISIKTNTLHFSNFYFPLFNIPTINTETVIQNLGNTYINEHGYLSVKSSGKSKNFNLPVHLILQNEKRILDKNIAYNFNIGSYTISSTLLYGYNQRSKIIKNIYIIPIYLIILLTFLIGFCILVLVKNKHLLSVGFNLILEKVNHEIKRYKKTSS